MTAISVDLSGKTPPFEQIKASIIELIATGALPVGHRLPSIRQLAGDLGVAANTVARSYRELEAGGFVMSRGRRGTSVLGLQPAPPPGAELLNNAVLQARRSGLSDAEIVASVMTALQ